MSTDDEYLEFIMSTLSIYKKYSDRLLTDTQEVFPQDVQYLLANYQSAKLGLLAETQRRLRFFRKLKIQYNQWWNTKVSDARRELIANQKSGSKFPALKEYSIKAQEDAGAEYDEWQSALGDAEDKYDFMKSLKGDWDSFQFILQILNSNMTSELRSLSIDRMSAPKVRQKRED